LLIDERNALLIEAARFYPGVSDREIARRLRRALAIYRAGRWQRDRSEATCPPQHRGKLVQVMWLVLKTIDHVPSERTVTSQLARARASWGYSLLNHWIMVRSTMSRWRRSP
jgi:hypothetical protein